MGVHFRSVTEAARTLGRIPVEMTRLLRPALTEAGQDLMRMSQENASWSTRIPAAHYLKVGLGSTTGGVTVGVDSTLAPHARPYEGLSSGGSRGFFRHPTWGDDPWVQEDTRPFIAPAALAEGPRLEQRIEDIVTEVTRI
jgi:hypothetical protein